MLCYVCTYVCSVWDVLPLNIACETGSHNSVIKTPLILRYVGDDCYVCCEFERI